jgi:hypothetical protein
MRTRLTALLAFLLLCGASTDALQPTIDLDAIDDAIRIGRSAIGTERQRLHQAYRIGPGKAPVDYVDIVTPFRRIVLATQERAERGQRGFGQKDALALLGSTPNQLDLYVEITFHPLNTYVGVPDYTVTIAGRDSKVSPESIDRLSRWTPRVDGMPSSVPRADPAAILKGPRTETLLGATVIAKFDVRQLDANCRCEVMVAEGGKELTRLSVDFSRIR